jgi:hypothetical protein
MQTIKNQIARLQVQVDKHIDNMNKHKDVIKDHEKVILEYEKLIQNEKNEITTEYNLLRKVENRIDDLNEQLLSKKLEAIKKSKRSLSDGLEEAKKQDLTTEFMQKYFQQDFLPIERQAVGYRDPTTSIIYDENGQSYDKQNFSIDFFLEDDFE